MTGDPADLGGYYLRAHWKGFPCHRCLKCNYERVNNEEALRAHVTVNHGRPEPPTRLSGLVGPDSKPLPSTQGG